MSLVPSIAILGLVALVALVLAIRFPSPAKRTLERAAASRLLAIATAIQSGHFAEEWAMDFHILFPALFGLPPLPLSFFVTFNITWICFWVVSIPLLRSTHKMAFFAAWFLAIAGMLNGLAHPLMAIASGGYFPGLISSPFIGLAGFCLWRRLRSATSRGESAA